MIVQKFGGTSLGSLNNFKKAMSVITNDAQKKIIVLSALSGVTNSLQEVIDVRKSGNYAFSFECLDSIRNRFIDFSNQLFSKPGDLYDIQTKISFHFNALLTLIGEEPIEKTSREILSFGEIITSEIVGHFLMQENISCKLIPASEYMRIERNREPDYYYIKENLEHIIHSNPEIDLFITQGFICKNFIGEIDNLKRGGSDKSATIIGKVLNSNVEIWSDRDGLLNNDPRCVKDTYALKTISYEEAEELASFGAKILHPSCIKPAKEGQIKVFLKNTLNPDAEGTVISKETGAENIKAVAAKDDVTVIKITSGDMLLAYGFLSKIFQIFEFYKTPVDMVSTSEVTVAVSIDDTSNLKEITGELKKLGKTEIFQNQTILAIVGNIPPEDKGITYKVFESLKEIPIRMISYGAGSRSINILINTVDKIAALNLLNNNLFFNHERKRNQSKVSRQHNTGLLV